MEKGTISSTILWQSYSPEEAAAGVAITIDTNLDNTRKCEFLWETHPQGESAFGNSQLFPGQGLSEGHRICSFFSNHGFYPRLTLTLPAWSWTCLDTGNEPGDLAGGHSFICMPEVVTPVRKETKIINISFIRY